MLPFFPASLIELRHLISSSVAFELGCSPGSRAFELGLNYNPSFPEPPACKGQTVGPFSLLHPMSQFLIINLSLIDIYIAYTHTYRCNIYRYSMGSVSLENPN